MTLKDGNIRCDACGKSAKYDLHGAFHTLNATISLAKKAGYLTVSINKRWFHACCSVCAEKIRERCDKVEHDNSDNKYRNNYNFNLTEWQNNRKHIVLNDNN